MATIKDLLSKMIEKTNENTSEITGLKKNGISGGTDWNQNDENAKDYIKNKPFYTEEVILCEKMASSEDNVLPVVTYELGKNYIVEVNNIPIELTFVSAYSEWAGEYRVGFNIEDGYRDVIMGDICEHALCSLNTYTEEELSNGLITDELRLLSGKLNLGSVNVKVLFTAIQQLDPKYIKDMYYEYIAPNTDLVLDAYFNAEGDNWWFYPDYFGLDSFLVEGATYIVTCNDETYTCTARRSNYGEIYIGNQEVAGWDEGTVPEIIESNEPFFLYTFEEEFDYGLCMQTAGEYSIVIRGTGEKLTPHKIDMKYMPDSIMGNIRNQWNEINNIYNNFDNKMNKNNPTGTGSFSMNRKAGTTVGTYSHAEGYDTTASGEKSHAEGYNTTASGNNSHAEGFNTIASGSSSHAEGYGTTSSGIESHAEGYGTTASGNQSHAEGYGTTAFGNYSHAEGNGTTAFGGYSHAEGCKTKAAKTNDATLITTVVDKGYYAHAEGYGTVAYGRCSHTEGNGTKASGNDSHSEGMKTVASGEVSHAEGNYTTASGNYSHAEGNGTTASGSCSHAEGNGITASGSCSHAEGESVTASGNCSHSEGYCTVASGENQHVQGKWNIDDIDADGNPLNTYAHIVGNGADINHRSNAHTLDWDGNAWFAGTVEGTAMIVKSSTEGSSKRFKITVDDSGTISAVEI